MPFDVSALYGDHFKLIMYITMGVSTGIFLIIAIAAGAQHLGTGGSSINGAVIAVCIFSVLVLAVVVAANWVPQITQLIIIIIITVYGVIVLIVTFACWGMGSSIDNDARNTVDKKKYSFINYKICEEQDYLPNDSSACQKKITGLSNSYRAAIGVLGLVAGLVTAVYGGLGLYDNFKGGAGAAGFTAVTAPASF